MMMMRQRLDTSDPDGVTADGLLNGTLMKWRWLITSGFGVRFCPEGVSGINWLAMTGAGMRSLFDLCWHNA